MHRNWRWVLLILVLLATSGVHPTQAEGSLGKCKTCIYVLERIKQGYQYLLPSICVEIWSKTQKTEDYGDCHEVLASLSVWGNNVRHWFQFGCYKSEPYGAMELIRPCPSHVICSQIADLKKEPFCKKPKTDFPDKFVEVAETLASLADEV